MPSPLNERQQLSSGPEDQFTNLFAQVFGIEKTQLLVPQYSFWDIYGVTRHIDFALKTSLDKIAFEIDGRTWHVPDSERIDRYEDDLLRQNSLIHQGWRVFRWTDGQLINEAEKVKEQLVLFLEQIPGLLEFDDFLPRQRGEFIELKEHQEEALRSLDLLRAAGNSIALLNHATGTGKTVTAIMDAKKLAGRTLFLVHTRDLVNQTIIKFGELWPTVSIGRFLDVVHDVEHHVIVGTIQSISRNLHQFKPDCFSYLIIDEAHHATADTYQKVLKYFKPKFTLGLTATPDRADCKSALEIFRNAAHRLSLQEAVESGELVPIRCVRVETNIDLSRVRFNEVQYNRRDIEEAILVPGRDRLIVDTYLEHVKGRKAVVFCVNVSHGERLASLFQAEDIPSKSVSGRMSARDRKETLDDFISGKIRVICACDLLNEGWDCPDVEVLFMARPTLSRVIYLQQLGRGTRKAPGKNTLIVFDFVDNASKYNISQSLHRVLGKNQYRKGGLVLGTRKDMQDEENALLKGKPPQTLPLSIWATDFTEIDIFSWQEAVKGLWSSSDLEMELAASEGRVREAAKKGVLKADHELSLGDRTYYYFKKDRLEEIRVQLNLPNVDDESIRGLFLGFIERMDMSASYKPVMILAFMDKIDADGRAKIDEVASSFLDFYKKRKEQGIIVERSNSRMSNPFSLTLDDAREIMLSMPFRKFEQRKFLLFDKQNLAFMRFPSRLWKQLAQENIEFVKSTCELKIKDYYDRISSK